MTPQHLLTANAKIFFVGIGGISMSGLAKLAQHDGFTVAGSDRHLGPRAQHLVDSGISVYDRHSAQWIDRFLPDLVVYSAAVQKDNPELVRARQLNIQTIGRAQFLAWLNSFYPKIINIAGTHGKTTTTALLALILIEAGLDPAVHLGAELRQFQGTVRFSREKQIMLSEACEYQNSFIQFVSTTAAVLNIDYDHVDSFANLDAVIEAFVLFANQVVEDGLLVIPASDPNVLQMLDRLREKRLSAAKELPQIVTFGIRDQAGQKFPLGQPDYLATDLCYNEGMPSFLLIHKDQAVAVQMKVPGRHHVLDGLAAVACAHQNGVPLEIAARVLAGYEGAEGRFTDIGSYQGARVIADYAHHPAATAVTLEAARQLPHKNMWVVYQPLTFSRTRVLFDDYVAALKPYQVIFAEIYSDRETDPGDMSSRLLVESINAQGGQASFAATLPEIKNWLNQRVEPDDLVLVLGPEDIRDYADQLTGRTSHLDG